MQMITLHIENRANIAHTLLRRAETAIVRQVDDNVDRYWTAGPIRFARKGLPIYISYPTSSSSYTSSGTNVGYHGWSNGPYAVVRYAAYTDLWKRVLSHEVIEMLVDPEPFQGKRPWREICDPVAFHSYTIRGVSVSDFVLPAYYTRAPGRRDWLGAIRHH